MKTHSRLSAITTIFLLLITLSAAWPWQGLFEHNENGLEKRQDGEQSSSSTRSASRSASSASSNRGTITSAARTSSDESASATDSASASGDSDSAAASETGSMSGSRSGSVTRSGSASRITGNSTRTTPIDPRLPPGGIQMITPAALDGPQYYKVGDYVTFKWNYTSLSVTPSAIDVIASCAVNSATYTIAANLSVEETGAVTWDLGEFQATATNPFPVASYTLMIHDAAKDVTDVPSAGYLGSFNQYVFGIYTGQPYTPLNDFKCATCPTSSALSLHERQALSVLFGTALVTVLSFTWFASGFGAFS